MYATHSMGDIFNIERKRLKRIIHFLKRTDDLGILYHSDKMELNTKTSPRYHPYKAGMSLTSLSLYILSFGGSTKIIKSIDHS